MYIDLIVRSLTKYVGSTSRTLCLYKDSGMQRDLLSNLMPFSCAHRGKVPSYLTSCMATPPFSAVRLRCEEDHDALVKVDSFLY